MIEAPATGVDWIAQLSRGLGEQGFDLAAGGPVGLYNNRVEAEWRLPEPLGAATAVVLVGSSSALWRAFRSAVRADPEILAQQNPLDSWADRVVLRTVEATMAVHDFRPAWQTRPKGVAIQKLAMVLGLASIAPSHLSAHRVVGPWLSLRAAIVLDARWVGAPPNPAAAPCEGCHAPCVNPLEAVRSEALDATTWRRWLEIRDACPVGREHRYDEDQIGYHYTKDRRILERLVGPG